MNILVTGSKGQLGSELKVLAETNKEYSFIFVDVDDLDITDKEAVISFFNSNNFDYCINSAAYTAVDKAEEDIENAEKVNAFGPANLAEACKIYNTTFIHVSTDFVFDGNKNVQYSEDDETNPINVYGETKLKGESLIQEKLEEYFILRTSWLYSTFGNNFVKTMQRLGRERDNLGIIVDQVGTPTYARDLAKAIMTIVDTESTSYGIYHYSNEGIASWYDFAKAIFDYSNIVVELNPIPTSQYPTPAKRPNFSVMDKSKIKENIKINIPHWTESLKECIALIESRSH